MSNTDHTTAAEETSAEWSRRKVELQKQSDTLEQYRAELKDQNRVEREGVLLTRYLRGDGMAYLGTIFIDKAVHGGPHRNLEPALREFARLVESRRAERSPITVADLCALLERAAEHIDCMDSQGHTLAAECYATLSRYKAQNLAKISSTT